MARGNDGDRVVVESERTGRSAREGVILEVIGTGRAFTTASNGTTATRAHFSSVAAALTSFLKRQKQRLPRSRSPDAAIAKIR